MLMWLRWWKDACRQWKADLTWKCVFEVCTNFSFWVIGGGRRLTHVSAVPRRLIFIIPSVANGIPGRQRSSSPKETVVGLIYWLVVVA